MYTSSRSDRESDVLEEEKPAENDGDKSEHEDEEEK